MMPRLPADSQNCGLAVQARFVWDAELPGGVYANIEAELVQHADALARGTLVSAV